MIGGYPKWKQESGNENPLQPNSQHAKNSDNCMRKKKVNKSLSIHKFHSISKLIDGSFQNFPDSLFLKYFMVTIQKTFYKNQRPSRDCISQFHFWRSCAQKRVRKTWLFWSDNHSQWKTTNSSVQQIGEIWKWKKQQEITS